MEHRKDRLCCQCTIGDKVTRSVISYRFRLAAPEGLSLAPFPVLVVSIGWLAADVLPETIDRKDGQIPPNAIYD